MADAVTYLWTCEQRMQIKAPRMQIKAPRMQNQFLVWKQSNAIELKAIRSHKQLLTAPFGVLYAFIILLTSFPAHS